MNRQIQARPGTLTPGLAKLSIVILTLFLLFGVGLLYNAWMDVSSDEPGLQLALTGFGLIWMVVCVGLIRFNLRLLRAGREGGTDSVFEFVETGPATGGDFAVRLRALEALRADGLVSEEEYREKRQEIMAEKW